MFPSFQMSHHISGQRWHPDGWERHFIFSSLSIPELKACWGPPQVNGTEYIYVLGLCFADFLQNALPISAEMPQPISADFGRFCGRFWLVAADSGRFRPIPADSGRFRPIPADSGRFCGRFCGRLWPIVADFRKIGEASGTKSAEQVSSESASDARLTAW